MVRQNIRFSTVIVAMTIWSFAIGSAEAKCGGEQEQVKIQRHIGERIYILSDGRRVKLSGVLLPTTTEALANQRRAFIDNFIKNPETMAVWTKKVTDRHNRVPGIFYHAHSQGNLDGSLQGILLSQGLALFKPEPNNDLCAAEFRRLESAARASGRGIWSIPNDFQKQADDKELMLSAGQFRIVTGTVISVGDRKRNMYLNFGQIWKQDFTVIIAKKDAKRFKGREEFVRKLKGRRIRVRGWVESRGGPMIRVTHSGQIEFDTQ